MNKHLPSRTKYLRTSILSYFYVFQTRRFRITQEEFLDFMFRRGPELPTWSSAHHRHPDTFKTVRAGISNDGNPSRTNIVRTLRSAHARAYRAVRRQPGQAARGAEGTGADQREEPDNLGDIQELELEIAKLPRA